MIEKKPKYPYSLFYCALKGRPFVASNKRLVKLVIQCFSDCVTCLLSYILSYPVPSENRVKILELFCIKKCINNAFTMSVLFVLHNKRIIITVLY